MPETEIVVGIEKLRGLLFGPEMVEIHGIRLEGRSVIVEVHGVGVPEGIGKRAVVVRQVTECTWLEPTEK